MESLIPSGGFFHNRRQAGNMRFLLANPAALTTMKATAPTVPVAEPATLAEFRELLAHCPHVLGNGSNTLIVTPPSLVAITRKLTRFSVLDTTIIAEAGVRLQTLIKVAANHGLGGIEYLWSVPATVGGAVYMNAGRGIDHPESQIHTVVARVLVYDRRRDFWLRRAECKFGYRTSIFHQRPEWKILAAELSLPQKRREEVDRGIRERINYVKEHQDHTAPNAGSVFRSGYSDGPSLRSLQFGRARMSGKTSNWLLNDFGPATDVLEVIKLVERHHSAPPEREIVVW
jgi:UDP-N-acetylmuramate dehydrogenase